MGYMELPMPDAMPPEMMRRLLGGKFPDTGFNWSMVHHFRFEDGAWEPYNWEPYNCFGEILPACGFRISVKRFGL